MTNPRVYKGRLFYDGSYTDEFQWVKYDEVKHLLHHEPTAGRPIYIDRAEAEFIDDACIKDGAPQWHELQDQVRDKFGMTPVNRPTEPTADARDAARYRWLRDDNAYVPEEQCVRGGEELDKLCDDGRAENR